MSKQYKVSDFKIGERVLYCGSKRTRLMSHSGVNKIHFIGIIDDDHDTPICLFLNGDPSNRWWVYPESIQKIGQKQLMLFEL